ncbi:putative hydrolase/peptidase [Aromatoleum aromaticum EbN1]|uniref:Hydrolase/peptidase n=1 Tax=Aromatoleum aromaticum (strain DSM 19018 / LMG 30748 / EbN1) TaxID=76114 RepID=Q5P0F7_AROAE|nr:M20 aminoacylase family protein [Aromatoleum aromaticum]CAI09207.1 putative hydrolase/peptidase [Aromatoleum aromaticum EbN1]
MSVIESIRPRLAKLTEIRRDLHAHPELAFAEHRTAELIARHLETAGIEVHRGLGRTGVVGVVRGGRGLRAIGLRADIDALPMQERNEFAHRSVHEGCMHACGHDGHATMLLGAADALAARRDFDGTVYLIFQPAEEGEGGGLAMIEDGLFERFPMESVFGMHNWPGMPAGQFGVRSGPVMASADRFDIDVRGHGAHAAMPHLGADPVTAGAALVQAIQTIVSRTLDPIDSAVVSVTRFNAGEAYNVIPDRARLCGTVRAFSETVQDRIESGLQRICDGVAAAFDVEVTLDYRRGYPPTINSAAEAAMCAEVASELVGSVNVATDARPSMGAEDFAYFLQRKPGCYVWIGNGEGEGGCMLHNPTYDFNDDIIATGVAYWVELVRKVLAPAR